MKRLTALAFTILIISFTYAQDKRFTLSGTIVNTQGKALSNVSIRVLSGGHTVQSNEEGKFCIKDLRPKIYAIAFSYLSF